MSDKVKEAKYLKRLFRLVGYEPNKYGKKCTEPRVSEIDPILLFTKDKFGITTVMYESRYVNHYTITVDDTKIMGTATTPLLRDIKVLTELLRICNTIWENQKLKKQ